MEKGQGPPSETPAPPYPGPPVGVYQPQPCVFPAQQPAFQYSAEQPPVLQHVVVMQSTLGDVPGQMTCPHCQSTGVTKTEHKNGLLTWLMCGVLGLFLCWPCCWIPFCVEGCKDVEHTCPSCKRVLHIYKRM